MSQDKNSGALAKRARESRDHNPGPGQERHQPVQWTLVNAIQLAHSQLEVLARLDEAEQAGDDESMRRCHAELDHVMALVTRGREGPGKGQAQVIPGWPYSVIAALEPGGTSWTGDGRGAPGPGR